MEASCTLGESFYEILADSTVKTSSDDRPGCPISRGKRQDIYRNIVYKNTGDISHLCQRCLDDFSYALNVTLEHTETTSEKYNDSRKEISLSEWHLSQNSESYSTADVEKLIEEILDLEEEYDAMVAQDNECMEQMSSLVDEEADIEREIQSLYSEMNNLDYEYIETAEDLCQLLSVTANAERELDILTTQRGIPLYCFQWAPVLTESSASLSSSIRPMVLSVNGLRACYCPQSEGNLNWAEICTAWSTLCCALLGFHNEYAMLLEDCTSYPYTYSLVPLRWRSVLIRKIPSSSKSSSSTLPETLRLQCADSHPPSGATHQYMQAMVALGIVVIETAFFHNRLDILANCPTLQKLRGLSVSMEAGAYDLPALSWPETNVIAKEVFSTRDMCVGLANDILLSVYTLLGKTK
mmetsp:Transcript_19853/g.28541  ORF Transcript_19853/g.28541 Transcript_19853/m.28541 type:complete len:410 (+) Transcript_19853:58-1287(+)